MTKTQHKNVFAALAAAQTEMEPARKSAENPHFRSKYADLASVVDAVRPALNAHGLAFFHIPVQDEFGHGVKTLIVHGDSDTSIECTVPLIIGKQDMQGYKSATTYAKRIGLESVTGVAPEDDDGNAAAQSAPKANKASQGLQDAWRDSVLDSLPEGATEAQKADAFAEAICAEFKGKGVKALESCWDKRKKIIASLESRFPELHARVVDAYENRMNDLTVEGIAAE